MDLKRRIALSAALVAVGLGAGQFVQSRSASEKRLATASTEAKPTAITSLSAGADAGAKVTPPKPEVPVQPVAQAQVATPVVPKMADKVVAPVVDAAVAPKLPEVAAESKPALPLPAIVAPKPSLTATTTPAIPPKTEAVKVAAADCVLALDLVVQPSAMLGVTLTAPCHKGERVVLKHGGLAITAQASATGSVFLTLPAMERLAKVTAQFADGKTAEAQMDVPELLQFRRFGVQWLADDAFQVHAFEGGADYGMPGHISAADPHVPLGGAPAKGGFLTLLGDGAVKLPMLAQIYTYPAATDAKVDVVVEAAVTPATCGRELLGETLTSFGGSSMVTDLTMAMPECDATGDILVLKNLVPEMKVAAN